ncbi:MAG: hypothetical protein QM652_08870 [Legionella sp.]|uniref:hypothetical protein n=1 Tax=Legionella sp. TaxID=459 RepID=UPI0039E399C3
MPSLTKEDLNRLESYANSERKRLRNSFFQPYTMDDFKDEKLKKQIVAALNVIALVHGYTQLIVGCGVAAAAVFGVKSLIENPKSSKESREYSSAILSATIAMGTYMAMDALNFVCRVLATAISAIKGFIDSTTQDDDIDKRQQYGM